METAYYGEWNPDSQMNSMVAFTPEGIFQITLIVPEKIAIFNQIPNDELAESTPQVQPLIEATKQMPASDEETFNKACQSVIDHLQGECKWSDYHQVGNYPSH